MSAVVTAHTSSARLAARTALLDGLYGLVCAEGL